LYSKQFDHIRSKSSENAFFVRYACCRTFLSRDARSIGFLITANSQQRFSTCSDTGCDDGTHHHSSLARLPFELFARKDQSAPARNVAGGQLQWSQVDQESALLTVVFLISLTIRSSVSWKSFAADLSSYFSVVVAKMKHFHQLCLSSCTRNGKVLTTASEASTTNRLSSRELYFGRVDRFEERDEVCFEDSFKRACLASIAAKRY